ncbi:MAG: translational GTPase TypA [Oligoflexia bacterium]|nr:translational GTPase TypA [Oligoflexia bacterium]
MKAFNKIKNIAIVAHVDHGKTTLVDGLLRQSGTLEAKEEMVERIMDSGDLEKEKGITITAKNCALYWKDVKVNLLDTPGHADFGGEVERSINMVDGVLLLVDAAEGPLPQTRFVLQKAMERNLKIAVIINKIDRPDERIQEVKHEIEDLFLELATILNVDDWDGDIPIIYASAKEGWATLDPHLKSDNLEVIFDFIVSDFFPEPKISPGNGLQLLVSNLSYSPYLGSLLIGRIQRGKIRKGENYYLMGEKENSNNSNNNNNTSNKSFRVTSVKVFDSLKQSDVDEASAGEIVIVAGVEGINIGDTVAAIDIPEALPRIKVEPPTVSVNVSVNTSPLSGKEGSYLTSRQLEDFLQDITKINVALKYERTDDPKVFLLKGRGEFQLAIVFEELRRKGHEFMLSRPEVLFEKSLDGEGNTTLLEPFEMLVLDIPSKHTGIITEALSARKGQMKNMHSLIGDRTRIEFLIPTRGLIGYRSQFLTDTRGEGLMSSYFCGHKPYLGKMLSRTNGAIISDRDGKTTPYALFNLLSSGKQFIRPGMSIYEGMIVGEHTRTNDINVNAAREKHLSSVRTAGKDENIILPPVPAMSLEFALSWIESDEWVEVTPQNVRIRKKILKQNQRSVIRK